MAVVEGAVDILSQCWHRVDRLDLFKYEVSESARCWVVKCKRAGQLHPKYPADRYTVKNVNGSTLYDYDTQVYFDLYFVRFKTD